MANTYATVQDVRNLFKNTDQSLADAEIVPLLIEASAWVENHAQRVLASASHTDFVPLQLDRYGRLVIRCWEWPITAVTAIGYKLVGDVAFTDLDPTMVDIYQPPERFIYYSGSLGQPTGTSQSYYYGRIGRQTPGTVQVTYTAGYTQPYPQDLILATALLTQDLIMADANPLGASTLQVSAEGAQQTISFGDESRNVKRAKAILDRNYTRRI